MVSCDNESALLTRVFFSSAALAVDSKIKPLDLLGADDSTALLCNLSVGGGASSAETTRVAARKGGRTAFIYANKNIWKHFMQLPICIHPV